jgi:arylsulfatase A-like enzyme
MVGKWHLGNQSGMLPHERGFDEFFGFAGGAHRYFQTEKGPNAIQRNGTPVEKIDYLTDAFTREAVAFIDRNKGQAVLSSTCRTTPSTRRRLRPTSTRRASPT